MKTLTMSKKDKRGVNVYLTVKLVDEARELGINLSATLDQMLSDAIREKSGNSGKLKIKMAFKLLMNSNRKWGYLLMTMNMGLFNVSIHNIS